MSELPEKSYIGWQPISNCPFSTIIVVSNESGLQSALAVLDDFTDAKNPKPIWMHYKAPRGIDIGLDFKPAYWWNELHELPEESQQYEAVKARTAKEYLEELAAEKEEEEAA